MNTDAASTAFSLDAYKWQNRLILIFAPSVKSPAYEMQMELFEGETAGLAERDILIIKGLNEGTSSVGEKPLDQAATQTLYNQFDVTPDQFRVILIGKDGTEKRRDDAPVMPAVLYGVIDAMPMRQREMRGEGEP